MSHFAYIAWSYAAAALGVAGLTTWIWLDLQRQKRRLAALEDRGGRRRRRSTETALP